MSSPPKRRRDEDGQAIVEMALVLPLVALLLAIAFNAWSAMQLSVRLTSAARAGALQAAHDLGAHPTQIALALSDATNAINAEEGVSGVYQHTNPAVGNYVALAQAPENANGVTINVVTITVTEASGTLVPFVRNFTVNAHATARYS